MISLSLVPNSENPISHLLFPCSPINHLWHSCPLYWCMKPFQDQWPLLSLMSKKAIICCLWIWSHGQHHVYYLVDVFVPGSSESAGWLNHCSSYSAVNPFSSLSSFSSSPIWDPVFSSMAGCVWTPLYLSCTSKVSQVTAIFSSSHQVPVDTNRSVWDLYL